MRRIRFFALSVSLFLTFCAAAFSGERAILLPSTEEPAYRIAGNEFQKYYAEITGEKLPIVTESNGADDFIVIGSDAVNFFVRELVERKVIDDFSLRTGSDDYRILSVADGGRRHLILAGGRGRSTLYAVYDFFERRPGCRWFWDGDIVPKREKIDWEGLDVLESPRFDYRALRYFAHRGLFRFQAEHWGPEEWAREIDWIVKKRLNCFMLRIGHDDIFQKAFPEIVDYPDPAKPIPEATRGYDNRSLFWPLEYRGELRRTILDYAHERDLMHPVDFGTMSHWYSRTPKQFLDRVKPKFLPQSGGPYSEESGLVWDIRDDRNLENYWKLTEADIKYYDKPELFHTIGIAERHCYKDRADNLKMKLYAYRRLADILRRHYPNAPLLLAGWDFFNTWRPEETRKFFASEAPAGSILWDYTSDGVSENNFTNWGVVGKFPYVFGIFLAYESSLDIRGRYDVIEKRQPVAENDPFCKGYILWPECSHSDIFMLDYFCANAWKPDASATRERLSAFCRDRYREQSETFLDLWGRAIPISQLLDWDRNFWSTFRFSRTPWNERSAWESSVAAQTPVLKNAPEFFARLRSVDWRDEFARRDSVDLARTVADRLITLARVRAVRDLIDWHEGNCSADEARKSLRALTESVRAFAELLGTHDDYSLWRTFEKTDAVRKIENPDFARVLLDNASNSYCHSHQYELANYWYAPTFEAFADWGTARLDADDKSDFGQKPKPILDAMNANYEKMTATPLSEMAPPKEVSLEEFRALLDRFADAARVVVR